MTAANNVALSAKTHLYQLWHDKREKSAAIRERVNGGFYSCAFCSLSSCAFPYIPFLLLEAYHHTNISVATDSWHRTLRNLNFSTEINENNNR